MKHLFIITCCLLQQVAFPQDSLITIKAGDDAGLLFQEVYRYPQFKSGYVHLLNGDSIKARLNYNLYEGEIHFINDGDTLQLADKLQLRSVVIDRDSFRFSDGRFFRTLAIFDFGDLVVEEVLRLHDEHRIGALGMARPTHNIDSKSSFISWQTLQLQLNRDLVFSRQKRFYYKSGNTYKPASRRALSQLFMFAGRQAFPNYERQFQPNLKDERALLRLFQHMQQLYKKRQ